MLDNNKMWACFRTAIRSISTNRGDEPKRIVGIKNVTINDFLGISGHPIMPGVPDRGHGAGRQRAGALSIRAGKKVLYFASIDKAQFRSLRFPAAVPFELDIDQTAGNIKV